MIPILFGAAARAKGVTAGFGIAAVATSGYCGFLAGPPLIGLAAELAGLQLGLVAILVVALAIAAFANLVCDSAERALVMADA
jgi:hypothetical protein